MTALLLMLLGTAVGFLISRASRNVSAGEGRPARLAASRPPFGLIRTKAARPGNLCLADDQRAAGDLDRHLRGVLWERCSLTGCPIPGTQRHNEVPWCPPHAQGVGDAILHLEPWQTNPSHSLAGPAVVS